MTKRKIYYQSPEGERKLLERKVSTRFLYVIGPDKALVMTQDCRRSRKVVTGQYLARRGTWMWQRVARQHGCSYIIRRKA